MVLDTDVLIWVLRGNSRAGRAVDAAESPAVSVITYMELLQGARDKSEARAIKSYLADMQFRTLPLTENIGHRATIYVEEYALADGVSMADALIAASVVENDEQLLTANQKHYRPIKELQSRIFKP